MSNSYGNKKILVINDRGGQHARPFAHLDMEVTENSHLLSEAPEEIAMVVFTGGADVSPELYGAKRFHTTMTSAQRDAVEVEAFNDAHSHGVPMVGICRGAQFLCVMAGGRLVQDVTGHTMCTHPIQARYPRGHLVRLDVRGDHHQMQYPWDLPEDDYHILGWSPKPYSQHYAFGPEHVIDVKEATGQLKVEPDVVWYPRIKGLAIQFHPEWMDNESPAVRYVRALVDHFLAPHFQREEERVQQSS